MKKNIPKVSPFTNTRKALRKQKRQQKKVHRQEHYLKKKPEVNLAKLTPGQFVKRPVSPNNEGPEIQVKTKKKPTTSLQDVLNRERQKELKEANKLKSQIEVQRRKMLLKANEEDDKIIKKLEKQLGLSKSKNKIKNFASDGLDYLLEICDRTTTEQIVAAEKHLANVENESDFEEDLAAVTGKEPRDKDRDDDLSMNDDEMSEGSEQSDFDDEASDLDGDSEMSEELEEITKSNKKVVENVKSTKSDKQNTKKKENIISGDDLSKVFSDDEVSHLSGDEESELDDDDDKVNDVIEEKPDVWEDIYGRKRDKEGNIIKEEKGVYIPPHLRNKDSTSDKELAQLNRQVKSVLNKLAGTNLHWACTSLENLYSSNSRNSVNSTLTKLWLEACVTPSQTPDRMMAEHAAVVAVLHANVATEIGAHFLEELTRRFDEMILNPQPLGDKRLDNLVSCLAHLYSFKIYHVSLFYDILNQLTEELSEKNIGCVVTGLRSVGAVLRKDSPEALKQFIHDTQQKIQKVKDGTSDGTRINFLVEVLMAIKNNNLNKIPNYDPSYSEHLKKAIRSVIRKGNYVTSLNIRLEDLLKAHERGKWWVVGSAWEGDHSKSEKAVKTLPSMDQKLLELARKQRMNTDVRRSIFCVIMSAQDYMDAFEKLQHLGLKGQQEREIVHVLLACCLQENTYNPYYGVLAQKLCDFDRKYQLSIQFAVWDKIKELENLPKHSVTNLAQLLIHLIVEKGLPLSVLKVVQFSDLNKHLVRFMRQILLAIIMNSDLQASLEVFTRISKSPKLHMFRESLKLFIQHFLIKNAGKTNSVLSEEEMATLRQRTLDVEKILTMYETKLKF